MTRGRVLLLEDDRALRGLLQEALAIEGFDVLACESFQQIHDAAQKHEADIVVADFWGGSQRTLPDNERQEIRQLGSFLPVVLLTGRSLAADITASELGARAVIRKPFDLDHLLLAVDAALGSHQP